MKWLRRWRKNRKQRPLANFQEWPLWELLEKEREFPQDHAGGKEIRAEIARRRAQRDRWILLASVMAAAVSAIGSMLAAIASWFTILHAK